MSVSVGLRYYDPMQTGYRQFSEPKLSRCRYYYGHNQGLKS